MAFGDAIARAVLEITAETSQYFSNMGEVRKDAKKLGGDLSSAGKALLPFTAMLAGIGVAALMSGNQIEEAMNTIRVGTGATGEELDGLKQSFENVFTNVPDAADKVALALTQIHERTGLTGQGLEDLATQVLDLSRITKTDLQTNIAESTRMFGEWSLSTGEQSSALDFMFRTSQQTGIGVDVLMGKMVDAGPKLKEFGFSFGESATLIGQWEQNGADAGVMLAGLGKAVKEFTAQNIPMRDGLASVVEQIERLGPGVAANNVALQVFGSKAGPEFVDQVLKGSLSVSDLYNKIATGKDTITSAAADTITLSQAWDKTQHSVMEALDPLGTAMRDKLVSLTPVLKTIAGNIGEVVQWFMNLPGPVLTTIGVIAGLVAVAGPVLMILGTLASSVASIIALFTAASPLMAVFGVAFTVLTGPIGIVIAAIVALGLIWWKWHDDIETIVGEVWDYVKSALSPLIDLVKSIGEAYLAFSQVTLLIAWDAIKAVFDGIVLLVKSNVAIYVWMWQQIGPTVTSIYGVIKTYLLDNFLTIVDGVKSGVDSVTGFFTKLKDTINGQIPTHAQMAGAITATTLALVGAIQPTVAVAQGIAGIGTSSQGATVQVQVLTEAQKAHAKVIDDLRKKMGLDGGLSTDALNMVEALGKGIDVTQLSKEEQIALAKATGEAIDQFVAMKLKVPDAIRTVHDEAAKLALLPDLLNQANVVAQKLMTDYLAGLANASRKVADSQQQMAVTALGVANQIGAQYLDSISGGYERSLQAADKFRDGMLVAIAPLEKEFPDIYARAFQQIQTLYDWQVQAAKDKSQHEIDLNDKTQGTIVERMYAAGVETQAQLNTDANNFKLAYEQMRVNGKFNLSELTAAKQKWKDAEIKANGDACANFLTLLSAISQAFTDVGSFGSNSFSHIMSAAGLVTGGVTTMVPQIKGLKDTFSALGKDGGMSLGNLASAATGVVGAIGTALDIGKKLFTLFAGSAGRDAVEAFAQEQGGFDALHASLLQAGAAGEALWVKLTQGVGKNDPDAAKAVIDQVKTLLDSTAKSAADAAQAYADAQDKIGTALAGTTAKMGGQATTYLDLKSKVTDAQKAYDDLLASGTASQDDIAAAAATLASAQTDVSHAVISSQDEFDRLSRVSLNTFNTLVASGVAPVDAMSRIGTSVDDLMRNVQAFGLQGGAAYDQLARWRDLTTKNQPLLDQVSGLNDLMKMTTTLGGMNADAFADMQAQGLDAYNQLLKAGMTEEEARTELKPLLEQEIQLNKDKGYAIDDATQKIIAQGVAAGDLSDAQESMSDVFKEGIGALIQALGFDLPAAWQKTTDATKVGGAAMTETFKAPALAAISSVSSALGSLNSDFSSGFTFPVNFSVGSVAMPNGLAPIPMASGGIGRVSEPTLFLAGEAGSEDVAFSGGGRSFGSGASMSDGHLSAVHDQVKGLRSDLRSVIPALVESAARHGAQTAGRRR